MRRPSTSTNAIPSSSVAQAAVSAPHVGGRGLPGLNRLEGFVFFRAIPILTEDCDVAPAAARRPLAIQGARHGRGVSLRPDPATHPRGHEGRAKAKGRLRAKQPKINPRREAHLVALFGPVGHGTAAIYVVKATKP